MTIYQVEIDESARNDLSNLLTFLKTVMSREGALRYIDVMVEEVQSLSLFAELYQQSRSMVIRKIHPTARRMLSHNRKWNYVFHIEDDTVVVDRILPSKMIVV
jgi:plasmid stabilization system protein ParE